MIKTFSTGTALALLLGTACLAQAQEGPYDDAIKARESTMNLFGWNIGVLSAMAKEKVDYDAERAAEAAANLDAVANLGQSDYWPEGSDSESAGNAENRALPAIWENESDFEDKMASLREATAALAPVAGNGLGDLQDGVGDVGSACKNCHDDYRAEKD